MPLKKGLTITRMGKRKTHSQTLTHAHTHSPLATVIRIHFGKRQRQKSFTFKSSLILWVLVFCYSQLLHIFCTFLRWLLSSSKDWVRVGPMQRGTGWTLGGGRRRWQSNPQDVTPDFNDSPAAHAPSFFFLYNFSSCCIFVSCFAFVLFCFVSALLLLLQLPPSSVACAAWCRMRHGIFVKLYTLC